MQLHAQLRQGTLLPLALAALSGVASAQGLIQGASLILYEGGPVPDAAGTPIPGLTFTEFANLSAAGDGTILIRGRMAPAAVLDEYALFTGSPTSPAQMVIRGNDQVPGMPAGFVVATTTGANGLSSSSMIFDDGTLMLHLNIAGAGVTTADDTVYLVGTPGNFSVLAREGDPAPGTTGAVYGALQLSVTTSGLNSNGVGFFKNTLLGGDVSGTVNNEGWFIGAPGAVQLVLRKGDLYAGAVTTSIGSTSNFNDAGQFTYFLQLSTTTGPTPATLATDNALVRYTPGVGHEQIMREGDFAPGTASAVFSGAPTLPNNAFTPSGRVAFLSTLAGGDVSGTTNDTGLWFGTPGAMQLAVREGDLCPGTAGAEFAAINASSLRHLDPGVLCFQADLRNGDVVGTTNNVALLIGTPGNWKLVARKGDVAPGTSVGGPGSTYSSSSSSVCFVNDALQIIFSNTLVSDGMGSPAGASQFYYDPLAQSVTPVWLQGESLASPAGPQTLTASNTLGTFANTSGRSFNFNQNGEYGVRMSTASSTDLVLVVAMPAPQTPPTNYCTAGTTSNGCVAAISASANPDVGYTDPCTISVANVEGQKTGLVFYGFAQHNAPWCTGGSSFLCVKSPTQRTPSQNSNGTAGACDGSFTLDWNAYQATNPTALGSPFGAGAIVDLQAWFRDPPSCKTTHLSNAIELNYQP